MNNNRNRRNPQHCPGCRFPCQQVLVHSPYLAGNRLSLAHWWRLFLSVVPPIAGLVHIRQCGDSLRLHFATPQSAHFFYTHPSRWTSFLTTNMGRRMTISPARIRGHPVQYHRQPHHHGICHLARNRPNHATRRRRH
ncbi:hypothetical protein DM01DRAFT_1186857 [Hesseltinella vesiculosa]|uniref:Uncharacterized protein n=1 Tax=Hesseltinella vesiculosa TaxID=101127 RepID=A0A1X2GQW9_9FUNG|nr:hypothetical protein DM01DRAFT_1186857 [Hesseltinella vesiculosa]